MRARRLHCPGGRGPRSPAVRKRYSESGTRRAYSTGWRPNKHRAERSSRGAETAIPIPCLDVASARLPRCTGPARSSRSGSGSWLSLSRTGGRRRLGRSRRVGRAALAADRGDRGLPGEVAVRQDLGTPRGRGFHARALDDSSGYRGRVTRRSLPTCTCSPPSHRTLSSRGRVMKRLQWCGRRTRTRLPDAGLRSVSVARVFCRARASALPGAKLDPPELVTGDRDGPGTRTGAGPQNPTFLAWMRRFKPSKRFSVFS